MAVSEGVASPPPTSWAAAADPGLAHPPHAGFVSTGEAAETLDVSASGREASFFLSFCESLGNFFIGVSVLPGALVVTAAEGSVGVGVGCSAARMALKKDLSLEGIFYRLIIVLKQTTGNFGKKCHKNVRYHVLKRPTYVR